jgi:hypothetical protein
MKNYIFVTNEGSTIQPDDLDIENMQVIGFGKGETAQFALNNMLAESQYIKETSFDRVSAFELKGDKGEYFFIKDKPVV